MSPQSAVILVVNENDVRFVERECQPPIAADRYRPMARQIALQGMEVVSRSVHVFGTACDVQRRQQPSQPLRVFGLNTSFGSSFGKPLQTFMPITEDHVYSV